MNRPEALLKIRADAGIGTRRWPTAAICLLLAGFTIATFCRTFTFGFVDYDDNKYVYENPVVARGLTIKGMVWALKDETVDYWHPLTWWSHMLDCQIFGLHAGGHHLVNVLLHALAAVFLFLALRSLTGSFWRSVIVALVFAVHPLRVESVAWISERKDVLSGVFFMLALWAYGRYVRQPSRGRYWAVAGWFGLALMSKNTVVTFPFVLLLLDWWPLGRLGGERLGWSFALPSLKEKIPFFAMSAAVCLATVLAPQEVAASAATSLGQRLGNALVSYVVYIRQIIDPVDLATPYPPVVQPLWLIGVALVTVSAISIAAWACRKNHPVVLMGWLWYLGMLFPMIGIVQIADQAHADRFTYLPMIGLAVTATWVVADGRLKLPRYQSLAVGFMTVFVLGACAFGSFLQTDYWQDSEWFARRAIDATKDNYVAHLILGNALVQRGDTGGAVVQYKQALQINPHFAPAENNLGNLCLQKDDLDEAIRHFEQAVQMRPDFTQAHENLANALMRKGRADEAIPHYEQALKLYPDYAEANYNLGNALFQKGRVDEAISHFERALQLDPGNQQIQSRLVQTLAVASLRRGSNAVELASEANRLTGGENPVILRALASALARAGRYVEAAETTQQALRSTTTQTNAALAAQLRQELQSYQEGSSPLR